MAVILPFLGIFTAMTIGLMSGWSHLKAHFEAKQVCRAGLIKSQMQAKKTIQVILALNKKAALLKVQKQIVLVQLGGCLISPATCNPMALARYQRILNEQEVLDALQKTTISNGERLMEKEYLQTAQKIQSVSSSWKKWLGLSTTMQLIRPQLAIEPTTSEKGTIYRLKPNFEKTQATSISWRQLWHSKINAKLNDGVSPLSEENYSLACSASLNEELFVTLQAVRLSPNSWSY